MAALDFPASPAVGQIFAPSGAPAYVWNGIDWAVITPGDRNPQSAAFRNIFINGNFGIDQRGQAIASFVGSAWAADRWLVQATGSNISRTFGAFTPGQVAVPGEPTRYLLLNVQSVAGAGNTVYLCQKIEGVRALGGGELFTLSFYGMCNVAKSVGFEIQRAFGTGGSTADDKNCQKRFDLTTSWQRFTHTFTMPTLAGKTIVNSSFDDCLWCILWLDAGANFNANASGIGQLTASALALANFQLEHGPVATEFERRPYGVELALCQRYFEFAALHPECFPTNFANGAFSFCMPFRTTKRIAATLAFVYSGLGNRSSSTSYGGAVDAAHLQVISTGAGNVFQNVNWTANSEL